MKRIEVYAKQTSNWGLLIGSLLFMFCSIYLFTNSGQVNSPTTAKIISVVLFIPSIFLFFFAIKKISKKQLVLRIDEKGIIFFPSNNLNYMEWKNITEIEDLKLPRQRIINIKLLESEQFIENESNKFLQTRMKFWFKIYGAVVSFDANTLDKNHFEILNIFDEFMDNYKKTISLK